MIVTCHSNSGADLPQRFYENNHGYFPESDFYPLEINCDYTVYGMCIVKGELEYLIYDVGGSGTSWYPAVLFSVKDGKLTSSWYFANWGEDNTNVVTAIWGYKELVLSDFHFDALQEREVDALKIFFKRKKEIDEELELMSEE